MHRMHQLFTYTYSGPYNFPFVDFSFHGDHSAGLRDSIVANSAYTWVLWSLVRWRKDSIIVPEIFLIERLTIKEVMLIHSKHWNKTVSLQPDLFFFWVNKNVGLRNKLRSASKLPHSQMISTREFQLYGNSSRNRYCKNSCTMGKSIRSGCLVVCSTLVPIFSSEWTISCRSWLRKWGCTRVQRYNAVSSRSFLSTVRYKRSSGIIHSHIKIEVHMHVEESGENFSWNLALWEFLSTPWERRVVRS